MPNTTTHDSRWRRRLLVPGALAACALAALVPAGSGTAADRAVMARSGNSGAQDFQFPGADTLALVGSDKYITYGASAHNRKVPYTLSGSGNTVTTSPTIDGDAMPHGAGAWTKGGSGIWTPGAFYRVPKKGAGLYYLFFTSVKAGTKGQHCIGVASSTSATSGFKAQPKPLMCPAKANRWAIDADVTAGPGGQIWMTFRDGQRAVGNESALSVVRLSFSRKGAVKVATAPHVMLRSNRLTWVHHKSPKNQVYVIENPSALYHDGSWYLFYSGNKWQGNYYATGIAYCGKDIGKGTCSPMPSRSRAYFSYSGKRAHYPAGMRYRGLPGNKRGPGAMDVYPARDGQTWVTWNYLTGSTGTDRKSRVGRLIIKGTGAGAKFRVTLK